MIERTPFRPVEPVRARDGQAAARLTRQNLDDYYAGYLAGAERAPLTKLLESPETQEKP